MDKKKRLLILIFVLILSGIVVIFIHKNGSMKGDSIMEENAISGDDNTHWFHSNGIITSIDNSQMKAVLIVYNVKCNYIHSDVDTLERVKIMGDLRAWHIQDKPFLPPAWRS